MVRHSVRNSRGGGGGGCQHWKSSKPSQCHHDGNPFPPSCGSDIEAARKGVEMWKRFFPKSKLSCLNTTFFSKKYNLPF